MFDQSVATAPACQCEPSRSGDRLLVDATECPADGDLASNQACRQPIIEALAAGPVDGIRIRTGGVDRVCSSETVTLLHAAARFATRVSGRDARLAELAREQPIAAAREARGRAGLIGDVVRETGLATFADRDGAASEVIDYRRVPSIAASQLDTVPPSDASLRDARIIGSGATARIFDRPDGPAVYQLEPLEYTLDDAALAALAKAKDRLVATDSGSPSDHRSAVEQVADETHPIDTLTTVLQKHTAGYGVLEDLFSDEAVSEVFVNAPATETQLFVRLEGETLRTNVTLTERGTDRLAAGLRAESGRAFSRAAPTIDTSLSGVGGADSIRVAGTREPASDGYAFALRVEGTDRWRLQRLVENGTVSSEAAGLLSVAMARGGAMLVAGPRGAGKTTMTSALLWELPPATRLLAIEDTPELPIRALQNAGRDVLRLEAAADANAAIDPATALRTALRFGNGALAVGEVRGEEAAVLYEAMRVGAASDTVIGTIHGEGYDGVKERVVADLGVPESSFAVTDLLVTLAPTADGKRVMSIEEVTDDGSAVLFEYDGSTLQPTPRLERGNSHLVASLSTPGETYADAMSAIETRAEGFERSSLQQSGDGAEARADV